MDGPSTANVSVWLATAPGPRLPALAGDREVDVAVVGGGITGRTCALLLKRSGGRVAVLESPRSRTSPRSPPTTNRQLEVLSGP
ncbi:MAG TPA: FAD-dependent oxidoreductase [Egibacteraceae bacterium]|nr:FAD-dependent oxidoreductase [Egibacteraceae bacterium]